MKKVSIFGVIVLGLMSLSAQVDAQMALRGGVGAIFDPITQYGGHASLILPFGSKPGGVMLAAEYYKKSGETTIPISIRGLYKASGESASMYLGVGTGLIYKKSSGTLARLISASQTKLLFSAVVGVNIKFSGPLGLFGEGTLDRALTSGAKNNLAAKAGLSITVSD